MSKIPIRDMPRPRRNTFAQAAAVEAAPAEVLPPEIVPEKTQEHVQAVPAPVPPAVEESATPPPVRPDPVPSTGGKKRKAQTTDILLSIPIPDKERMVNTIAHTAAQTGIRQQQVFIRYAVARLCEDIETRFNGGERYTPPPEGPTL